MKLLPVLSLCLLSCSAAFGSKVVTVREGSDVILNCSLGKSIESELFEWKKDGQNVFFYNGPAHQESYNSRVSHFPDGLKNGDASIKIRQTMMDDSGKYTCSFPDLHQTFNIQLVVVVEPPVKVIVMEDSDAILPCSLGSNIESTLFDWRKDYQKDSVKDVFMYDGGKQDLSRQSEQFRGRVSHFPDELKNGNASIKITETKLADGGNYTCIFPHPRPERRFNVELVVDPILKDRSRDNIPGAAREACVTILHQTNDGVQLRCFVRGASPKPQLQWQDSDGNVVPAEDPQISERGGSYDVILQATVTKTDTYRCVVTQEEINHQTQAQIYVPRIGSSSSSIRWFVLGVFTGILLSIAVFYVFKWYKKKKDCLQVKSNQTEENKEPQESEHLNGNESTKV